MANVTMMTQEDYEGYAASRPNPFLSNWPVPSEPFNGEALGFYSIVWPYGIVFCFWLGNITSQLWIAYGLWSHRKFFPVSLQPIHLNLLTCLCSMGTYFCLTGHILFPNMPCWIHLFTANFVYFPYNGIGWALTARLYIAYNAQADIARGKRDSWFIKRRELLKGYKIDIAITIAAGIIGSGTLLGRIFGVYKYSHLLLPVADPRCGSLSTAQFVVRMVNTVFAMRVLKFVTNLVKDVPEPFPFKILHHKVQKLLAGFVLFNDVPAYLKQFYVGINPTTYKHICWTGSIVWGCALSHAQVFIILATMVKHAKALKRGENLFRMGGLYTTVGTVSGRSSIRPLDSTTTAASSVQTCTQLKDLLYPNAELQSKFRDYLVREFCVENMLFVQALGNLREMVVKAGTIAKPKAGSSPPVGQEKDVYSLLTDISDNYVKTGGLFEINVGSSIREKTCEAIEAACTNIDALSDQTLQNIFGAMEDEVFLMLIEPYNRFRRRASRVDLRRRESGHLPPTSHQPKAKRFLSLFKLYKSSVALRVTSSSPLQKQSIDGPTIALRRNSNVNGGVLSSPALTENENPAAVLHPAT